MNTKDLIYTQILTKNFEKKILNNTIYKKVYIRPSQCKTHNLMDLYNSVEIQKSYDKKINKSLRKVGMSFFANVQHFINQRLNSFQFTLQTQKIAKDKPRYRELLTQSLILSKEQSRMQTLLLLKSIKGGYKSYCSGLIAFIPSSQLSPSVILLKENLVVHKHKLSALTNLIKTYSLSPNIFRIPCKISEELTRINITKTGKRFLNSRIIEKEENTLTLVFLSSLSSSITKYYEKKETNRELSSNYGLKKKLFRFKKAK